MLQSNEHGNIGFIKFTQWKLENQERVHLALNSESAIRNTDHVLNTMIHLLQRNHEII